MKMMQPNAFDDKSPKTLIIGATGFVGRALALYLIGDTIKLPTAKLAITSRNKLLPEHQMAPAVNSFQLDLRDPEKIKELVGKWRPSRIYFCASLVAQKHLATIDTITAEKQSVTALLQAAVSYDVAQTIVLNSGSIYGQQKPIEANMGQAESAYDIGKRAISKICRTFRIRNALNVLEARLFNVYGPNAVDSHVTSSLFRELRQGNNFSIDNPDVELDFIHIDDVVRMLEQVSQMKDLPPVLNFCTGIGTSLKSLGWMVADALEIDRSRVLLAEKTGTTFRLVGDTTLSRKHNLKAEIDINQGIFNLAKQIS